MKHDELFAVITTIQPPTPSVLALHERLTTLGGRLVVAGDKKGPVCFDLPQCDFLSLADQVAGGYALAEHLPVGHYARKNIGYLHAMRAGALCIYETDDDNAPLANWSARSANVNTVRSVEGRGWINVYRYFTSEVQMWPRGFPLQELHRHVPPTGKVTSARSPVQQGLVNGSPDVDAIWRLTQDRLFAFDEGASVFLGEGQWCPFNTQSTWWWPEAFPLLYVPSYCSFRMCDIWKSFIAQRCLWAMGTGVVFHAPEVVQDRNPHDYLKDFADEVPGYLNNARIAALLEPLELKPGSGAVADNLLRCYQVLISAGLFPTDEEPLVRAWIKDVVTATSR